MSTSEIGHSLGKYRSHLLTVPDLWHWSLGPVTSGLINSGDIMLHHVWIHSLSAELFRRIEESKGACPKDEHKKDIEAVIFVWKRLE